MLRAMSVLPRRKSPCLIRKTARPRWTTVRITRSRAAVLNRTAGRDARPSEIGGGQSVPPPDRRAPISVDAVGTELPRGRDQELAGKGSPHDSPRRNLARVRRGLSAFQ